MTGASDGLGLAAVDHLTRAGATVVMACRNHAKADTARAALERPEGALIGVLDLADLASVRAFAAWFGQRFERLDLLINNAGVMTPPPTLSVDGVELQWATNHLGHFALTLLLVGKLLQTPSSRVVNVSSLAATSGNIDDRDPTTLEGYRRFPTYADSKLANLVFTVELDRRFERLAGGQPSRSRRTAVAAHPGITHTNLSSGIGVAVLGPPMRLLSRFLTQPVEAGVAPILRAATDRTIDGGSYVGPAGDRQRRGPAVEVPLPEGVSDPDRGLTLWQRSARLSAVDWIGT